MSSSLLTRRWVAVLGAGACLLLGSAAAGVARAADPGILPPRNPAADCDRAAMPASLNLSTLNACRANEGVGPLTLPVNWSSLTPSQQQLVIINLERVNRGVAPIVGLSASLSALAAKGALADNDPPFPGSGFGGGGGGIWAASPSVLAADYAWMYDDGSNGFDANVECRGHGGSGCWLHRDIILWRGDGGPLVAGAGYVHQPQDGSYAFEVLSGYSTANLTFTWADELRYFTAKPGLEPASRAARKAAAERRAARAAAVRRARAAAVRRARAAAVRRAVARREAAANGD